MREIQPILKTADTLEAQLQAFVTKPRHLYPGEPLASYEQHVHAKLIHLLDSVRMFQAHIPVRLILDLNGIGLLPFSKEKSKRRADRPNPRIWEDYQIYEDNAAKVITFWLYQMEKYLEQLELPRTTVVIDIVANSLNQMIPKTWTGTLFSLEPHALLKRIRTYRKKWDIHNDEHEKEFRLRLLDQDSIKREAMMQGWLIKKN